MILDQILTKLIVFLGVLLACAVVLLWLLYSFVPRWESQRRAQLPREIATALAGACKAAESCLAMCEAVAIVKTLQTGSRRTVGSGPTEAELLAKRKAASGKVLKKCRRLSVEAVTLTVDARYVLLRGLFQCAEAACGNCHPMPGQKICPALEFLKKISLEV